MFWISSLRESWRQLFANKTNASLFAIPIAIGVLLYATLGWWMVTSIRIWAAGFVASYVASPSANAVINWIFVAVFTILFFLIANWTFVLVVSLVASPFNDLLSSRIEKQLKGETPPQLSSSIWQTIFKRLPKMIVNEALKLAVLLFLGALAFGLALIPGLAPVSLGIYAFLTAAQFLDYNWSRHELGFSQCFRHLFGNFFGHGMSGFFFLLLISIPVVNLLVPGWATAYYTLIWTKTKQNKK